MNLRVRFVLWFALLVALLISLGDLVIYFQSSEFRREEFFERLYRKALTTQRLLMDVDEIDSSLLKIIDRNTLTTLPNERVLVFDGLNRIIYDTAERDTILESPELLNRIRREKRVQITNVDTNQETLGLYVENSGQSTVVLATAFDFYGFRKISNLRMILFVTWLFALVLTVALAYWYVRFIVGKPLANLTEQVAAIQEHDLGARIRVPVNQNELTLLGLNFNELLSRLQKAFDAQRNFVQYASHELRTPLANMLSETENMLSKPRPSETYVSSLRSLREEQSRLVDLTNSLLLLSRFETVHLSDQTPEIRIDEVLYNTIEEMQAVSPDFRIVLDFVEIPGHESDLLVRGNAPLLRTAFRNLLENACKYSIDSTVAIKISITNQQLSIGFENFGPILDKTERTHLFTPFFRGMNTKGKRGYGLGLVIAHRILQIHGALLDYVSIRPDLNRFIVKFPQKT